MELEVWLGERRVGWFGQDLDAHHFTFAYDPAWLVFKGRYPLSPRLPLAEAGHQPPELAGTEARRFFENLLPEGQALDDAAAAYRLSKSHLMGLLIALGGETAGAVRIQLPGSPPVPGLETRRALGREELSLRIRARPGLPFSVWDGKVRLSIAGYQDKIAILRDGEAWFLVNGGPFCSTHILKPEPVQTYLRGLTVNEFFCLRLARRAGLMVANSELLWIPEPVLLVERFDRIPGPDRVVRRHLIDGCQALGLAPAFKYERPYGEGRDVQHLREGASLPRLFGLLDSCGKPAFQRLALLRWVIFQVLIGNPDAHAKNVFFFMGPKASAWRRPMTSSAAGLWREKIWPIAMPWLSVMPSGPRISRLTNGRTSLRPPVSTSGW
jgi:serine/threonine-protein kinase HipA